MIVENATVLCASTLGISPVARRAVCRADWQCVLHKCALVVFYLERFACSLEIGRIEVHLVLSKRESFISGFFDVLHVDVCVIVRSENAIGHCRSSLVFKIASQVWLGVEVSAPVYLAGVRVDDRHNILAVNLFIETDRIVARKVGPRVCGVEDCDVELVSYVLTCVLSNGEVVVLVA